MSQGEYGVLVSVHVGDSSGPIRFYVFIRNVPEWRAFWALFHENQDESAAYFTLHGFTCSEQPIGRAV